MKYRQDVEPHAYYTDLDMVLASYEFQGQYSLLLIPRIFLADKFKQPAQLLEWATSGTLLEKAHEILLDDAFTLLGGHQARLKEMAGHGEKIRNLALRNFTEDPQTATLYAAHSKSFTYPQFLREKKTTELAKRISADNGIECPALEWAGDPAGNGFDRYFLMRMQRDRGSRIADMLQTGYPGSVGLGLCALFDVAGAARQWYDESKPKRAMYIHATNKIVFQSKVAVEDYLVHEMCHAILNKTMSHQLDPSHSAFFIRTFIAQMEKYANYEKDSLKNFKIRASSYDLTGDQFIEQNQDILTLNSALRFPISKTEIAKVNVPVPA